MCLVQLFGTAVIEGIKVTNLSQTFIQMPLKNVKHGQDVLLEQL